MNTPFPTHRNTRRQFLRGLGVGLALPCLASGRSQLRGATDQSESPHRLLIISNNLGLLPKPFFPKESGRNYQNSPYLKELEDFRDRYTVFSGLSHPNVAGGHSTENCFLTAARDPTGTGFRNTISLDQYATDSLPRTTRFPSLNLGVNIDKANRSLSWTRNGILLPAVDSPAALFQKLFIQGNTNEVRHRVQRLKENGSILDTLTQDLHRFQKSLAQDDRERLDQYTSSVRELEKRLLLAGEWELKPKPKISREAPDDITDKSKFFDKLELMLSMAQLALETDSTRVITLMIDAFATPVFEIDSELRSLSGYHNLSHHGQLKENLDQLEKVDHRQMRLLRKVLSRLSETKDKQASLLEKTMVLYGSNMGDSNTHDNTNLPILLAGGGFKHGQHLAFDKDRNKPLANLFVSMLQRMNIETNQFASSTGTLTSLELT